MKKYETPEVEITPIFKSDVLTESTVVGGGAFDLEEDEF